MLAKGECERVRTKGREEEASSRVSAPNNLPAPATNLFLRSTSFSVKSPSAWSLGCPVTTLMPQRWCRKPGA